MAFSPEPLPAEEPYASDETVWKISDGLCAVSEGLEYAAHAIKRLVQERDDAIAASVYNSEVSDDLKIQVEALKAELNEMSRHQTVVKQSNKRKLSDFEASQIRDYARQTGAKVKDIANRWGVHSSTISRILNGKAY